MTQQEYKTIQGHISQIIDDIAGNPDWAEAAEAVAADLGTLERKLKLMVRRAKPNEDVPLEGVVKWIARERDGYKAKLAKLVPYTKELEAKVAKLVPYTKELEAKVTRYEKALNPSEDGELSYNSLLANFKHLKGENLALRTNLKESDWYRTLYKKAEKYRKECVSLRRSYKDLVCENIKLQKQKEVGKDRP